MLGLLRVVGQQPPAVHWEVLSLTSPGQVLTRSRTRTWIPSLETLPGQILDGR